MLSTRTCDTGRQMFGTIAYCRGVVVAIRKFSVSSIDLNKKNLLELKQVLYVIYNSFHFRICKLKMVYNGEPIDYYTYYIRGPVKWNRLTHTFHYLMHQNFSHWDVNFHFIWWKQKNGTLLFCHNVARLVPRHNVTIMTHAQFVNWLNWKVFWYWLNIE